MSYTTASQRHANTERVTLASAVTVSGTGAFGTVLELADRCCARLDLSATAGTTPNITVTVQTGPTAAGPWTSVAAFTAVTGATTEHKLFSPLDRFVQLNATAASGSSAITVTGEAV